MIEKAVVYLLCLLVGYTSWVHSGSPGGYQHPILWIVWALWLIVLIDLVLRIKSLRIKKAGAGFSESLICRILKDPLFYPILIFAALLCFQWFNSGRFQYFDDTRQVWLYSEPFYHHLPSAVTSREAGEMFVWFLPPFTAALLIRNAVISRSEIRKLFGFLIINASGLGILGIIQFITKSRKILWHWPAGHHFFATFGYQNHAGEFFFLMFCLTLGILFRHLFLDKKAGNRMAKTIFLSGACFVMITSIHLALVAASTLLLWFVIAFSAVYALKSAAAHLSPAKRIEIMIGMIMLSTLAFFAVTGVAREQVMQEMHNLVQGSALIKQFDTRFWQVVTAWQIWLDNVWFGVGGWGYRYLAAGYLPQEARFLIQETGRGNVHNDTMQFLAEFGLVGTGALVASAVILFRRILRYPMWRHGLYVLVLLGLVLLYVHSMIDLPFRNPAILLVYSICLSGIGCYAKLSAEPAYKAQ